MPAGNEQQQIGKFEIRVDQPWRKRMAFQMVDRNQRLVHCHGERLRSHQTDHHPADQPRPCGGGNRIDILQCHTRIGKRGFDQGRHQFGMRPRGDFRHHAAKSAMVILLPRQRVAQYRAIRTHQCRCGFVATRFKAQNHCHRLPLRDVPRYGQAA